MAHNTTYTGIPVKLNGNVEDQANETYIYSNETVYYSGCESSGEHVFAIQDQIIYRVCLPIICTCGIIGIILTLIVLSRKNMCTSTNCYLMALASADLLFLILFSSHQLDRFCNTEMAQNVFQIYMTYTSIFLNVFLIASIWLTVMLAIERYIAICQPFLATKLCTPKKARLFIVIIYIVSFACRMPNFWEHKIMFVKSLCSNTTIPIIFFTDYSWKNEIYPWFVDGAICSIIPFLLLLVLNVRLIWEVKKSSKYIKQNLMIRTNATSIVRKEELQITIMLISVVIVFFVCQAPYVVYTAMTSIDPAVIANSNFQIFHNITLLLLTLKSAVNFILYCWFSEKFWATLKRIFCVEQCMLMKQSLHGNQSQNGNYSSLSRRFSTATTKTSTF